MLDLLALDQLETGLAAIATPVPGLTRDLRSTHEAPDQVRGGVGPWACPLMSSAAARCPAMQGRAA